MGCTSSSSVKTGARHTATVSSDRLTPAIVPSPSTLQYLVQCNHCNARLELCVPPDTVPGIRIETSCAGCQRMLQVRLGNGPGRNNGPARRNIAEGLPMTTNQNLLSHSIRGDSNTGEKALKEAIASRKRDNLVNELPREMYSSVRHERLTECEFCLQDYKTGDELMRLPCMHCFHSDCAAPWLRKAGTCPICQIDCCEALS